MSWTAGICMSPKAEENEEAFDFFRYYTDFNEAIHAAQENKVALGGLPIPSMFLTAEKTKEHGRQRTRI
ncbi:MAG: hypothetical protein ACLRMZ_01595 [Blautia marasmi]